MSFGDQTVGIITVTLGDPDPNGVRPESRTQVNVSGCHFRPLKTEELVGPLSTVTSGWKLTADPVAAVLNAVAGDELVYDGTSNPTPTDDTTYALIGDPMPYTDFGGTPVKVTVVCEKQKG